MSEQINEWMNEQIQSVSAPTSKFFNSEVKMSSNFSSIEIRACHHVDTQFQQTYAQTVSETPYKYYI